MLRRARPCGVLLIEVLVSLVILTVSLVGILQGLLLAAHAVAATDDRSQAEALVQAQAGALQLQLLTTGELAAPGSGGRFPPPHDRFRWELLTHETGANGAAHHVALAVAWHRGRREGRETVAWDCWIPPAAP